MAVDEGNVQSMDGKLFNNYFYGTHLVLASSNYGVQNKVTCIIKLGKSGSTNLYSRGLVQQIYIPGVFPVLCQTRPRGCSTKEAGLFFETQDEIYTNISLGLQSVNQIQPEYVENEQADAGRDGTAEPVSRDQILWRERGQRTLIFPCSADHVCIYGCMYGHHII